MQSAEVLANRAPVGWSKPLAREAAAILLFERGPCQLGFPPYPISDGAVFKTYTVPGTYQPLRYCAICAGGSNPSSATMILRNLHDYSMSFQSALSPRLQGGASRPTHTSMSLKNLS